ncbi:Caldesmon [Colwellia sp. MT41]|uniref:Caldesmon n=1 Tax=Colwellia marinimaniae TaxID=1513592 RepID=A0ABQ0MZV8_9GAMM|nr:MULTISPECIES: DUF2130 domain-containing protein [Colwellia]ALO34548.1 Caldesmon [Colwellia sp. MT41]GAW97896.1 hypothetical protein MTCD1_03545 [Colwellia marinimaniae]
MENIIHCPKCNEKIDVSDAMSQQMEQQLNDKYQQQLKKQDEAIAAKKNKMDEAARQLALDKKSFQQDIDLKVAQQLKADKVALTKQLKSQFEQDNQLAISALQDDLTEKSKKLKLIQKIEIENERLKREKDEAVHEANLAAEKAMSVQLKIERTKINEQVHTEHELKLKEHQSLINSLKEQIDITKRKAEQGSMQLQGEVQELAIEEWLEAQYPFDQIEEIKKGAQGADCLQHVVNSLGTECGTIYYESKRTKSFQPSWIEKFKQDIRDKNASVGVLVTAVMPKDMKHMGQVNGVWICTFEEFKGLSLVLRESLIKLSKAIAVQENRGDKMVMMYNYLTSNDFSSRVEAIVEGFTELQTDLNKEKLAMARLWKKREKNIEKVLLNTTEMFGSVKGIAGSSVADIGLLELAED